MTEVEGPLPDITVTPATHAMNTGIDLDSVTLGPDPVTTAIGVVATMTLVGVDPDHSTDLSIATSHVIEAPAPTAATTTHPHCRLPLTGIPPEMTADLDIDPENNITNWPKDLHPLHTSSWKSKNRKHKQVTIDNPPLEYYSSDDNDSDFDDDLN